MILSDKTLKKLINSGELIVSPLTEQSIQPASIDCRLGNHFLIADDSNMEYISMSEPIKYREITSETITIPPKSFVLGTTIEYIELPDNLAMFIEGRSSIGRMGLFIENAGWVDPGFKGKLTLELYNANSVPIKLEAGRRICQFVFSRLDFAAEKPYGSQGHGGKYQGQSTTVGSRVSQDEDKEGIS